MDKVRFLILPKHSTTFLQDSFVQQLAGTLTTSSYWIISYFKMSLNYFLFPLTRPVFCSDFKVWSQHIHKNSFYQLVKYTIMNTNTTFSLNNNKKSYWLF